MSDEAKQQQAFETAYDADWNDPAMATEREHFTRGWNAAIELDRQQRGDAVAWQPIETAPKDGRTLLLGRFNSHGKWRTMRGQWMSEDYIAEHWEDPDSGAPGWFETAVEAEDIPNCWPIEPTHWMPLPVAPQPAEPVVYLPPDTATFDEPVVNQSLTGEQQPVDLEPSRCANCGCTADEATGPIRTEYPEEGEWFCSDRCYEQHAELGCPHETHNGYRHPVETERLIQAEAALARPTIRDSLIVAEPVKGEPEIRRMLCRLYAGHKAYMDDGEAQDNRANPFIDFLNDSAETIQQKMLERSKKAIIEPATGEPNDEEIMALVGQPNTSMSDSRPLGQQWDAVCNLVRTALARYQGAQPAAGAEPCRLALAELVVCKDIKDRAEALHFAGPASSLGEGWEAEYNILRADYIKRQPEAWIAARKALSAAAPRPSWLDGGEDAVALAREDGLLDDAAVPVAAQPATSAEPIQVTAVATVTYDDSDEGPVLKISLEGGASELPDGAELVWASTPITGNDGRGVVYTAPVAAHPSVPDDPAEHLLREARKYWKYAHVKHYGAVQWIADGESGELLIYTRGEYHDTLMRNIDRIHDIPVAARPNVPIDAHRMLRRWLDYGRSQHMARHLVADTEAMLAAAPTPPADGQPDTQAIRDATLEEAAALIESTHETTTICGGGPTQRSLSPRKVSGDITGLTWAAGIRALKSQPAAGAQDREDACDIEAAAKTLTECMNYPWESMPEQGRESMRRHAQSVVDAARSVKK